jgi:hypothetical protein
MRFRVELSKEAQKQLAGFPRDARERIERAIDEFEERDDAQWANVKALQGPQWKGSVGYFSHPDQIQRYLSVTPDRLPVKSNMAVTNQRRLS